MRGGRPRGSRLGHRAISLSPKFALRLSAPAPEASRPRPAQPKGEFGEKKSKPMKAKLLSFPFISFSESGLFKGLGRIQIKKSGPLSTRLSGCAPTLRRTSSRPPRFAPPVAGRARRTIDRIGLARLVVENDSLFLQVLLDSRFEGLVDAVIGGHAVDLVHELLARVVVIGLVGARD